MLGPSTLFPAHLSSTEKEAVWNKDEDEYLDWLIPFIERMAKTWRNREPSRRPWVLLE